MQMRSAILALAAVLLLTAGGAAAQAGSTRMLQPREGTTYTYDTFTRWWFGDAPRTTSAHLHAGGPRGQATLTVSLTATCVTEEATTFHVALSEQRVAAHDARDSHWPWPAGAVEGGFTFVRSHDGRINQLHFADGEDELLLAAKRSVMTVFYLAERGERRAASWSAIETDDAQRYHTAYNMTRLSSRGDALVVRRAQLLGEDAGVFHLGAQLPLTRSSTSRIKLAAAGAGMPVSIDWQEDTVVETWAVEMSGRVGDRDAQRAAGEGAAHTLHTEVDVQLRDISSTDADADVDADADADSQQPRCASLYRQKPRQTSRNAMLQRERQRMGADAYARPSVPASSIVAAGDGASAAPSQLALLQVAAGVRNDVSGLLSKLVPFNNVVDGLKQYQAVLSGVREPLTTWFGRISLSSFTHGADQKETVLTVLGSLTAEFENMQETMAALPQEAADVREAAGDTQDKLVQACEQLEQAAPQLAEAAQQLSDKLTAVRVAGSRLYGSPPAVMRATQVEAALAEPRKQALAALDAADAALDALLAAGNAYLTAAASAEEEAGLFHTVWERDFGPRKARCSVDFGVGVAMSGDDAVRVMTDITLHSVTRRGRSRLVALEQHPLVDGETKTMKDDTPVLVLGKKAVPLGADPDAAVQAEMEALIMKSMQTLSSFGVPTMFRGAAERLSQSMLDPEGALARSVLKPVRKAAKAWARALMHLDDLKTTVGGEGESPLSEEDTATAGSADDPQQGVSDDKRVPAVLLPVMDAIVALGRAPPPPPPGIATAKTAPQQLLTDAFDTLIAANPDRAEELDNIYAVASHLLNFVDAMQGLIAPGSGTPQEMRSAKDAWLTDVKSRLQKQAAAAAAAADQLHGTLAKSSKPSDLSDAVQRLQALHRATQCMAGVPEAVSAWAAASFNAHFSATRMQTAVNALRDRLQEHDACLQLAAPDFVGFFGVEAAPSLSKALAVAGQLPKLLQAALDSSDAFQPLLEAKRKQDKTKKAQEIGDAGNACVRAVELLEPLSYELDAALSAADAGLGGGGRIPRSVRDVVKAMRKTSSRAAKVVRKLVDRLGKPVGLTDTVTLKGMMGNPEYITCPPGYRMADDASVNSRVYLRDAGTTLVEAKTVVPVLGLPITLRFLLRGALYLGGESTVCTARIGDGEVVAVAPYVTLAVDMYASVGLGVPMGQLYLEIGVRIMGTTLSSSAFLELNSRKFCWRLDPSVSALSGQLVIGVEILFFKWGKVLVTWRGVRHRLPSTCMAQDADAFDCCDDAAVAGDAATLMQGAMAPLAARERPEESAWPHNCPLVGSGKTVSPACMQPPSRIAKLAGVPVRATMAEAFTQMRQLLGKEEAAATAGLVSFVVCNEAVQDRAGGDESIPPPPSAASDASGSSSGGGSSDDEGGEQQLSIFARSSVLTYSAAVMLQWRGDSGTGASQSRWFSVLLDGRGVTVSNTAPPRGPTCVPFADQLASVQTYPTAGGRRDWKVLLDMQNQEELRFTRDDGYEVNPVEDTHLSVLEMLGDDEERSAVQKRSEEAWDAALAELAADVRPTWPPGSGTCAPCQFVLHTKRWACPVLPGSRRALFAERMMPPTQPAVEGADASASVTLATASELVVTAAAAKVRELHDVKSSSSDESAATGDVLVCLEWAEADNNGTAPTSSKNAVYRGFVAAAGDEETTLLSFKLALDDEGLPPAADGVDDALTLEVFDDSKEAIHAQLHKLVMSTLESLGTATNRGLPCTPTLAINGSDSAAGVSADVWQPPRNLPMTGPPGPLVVYSSTARCFACEFKSGPAANREGALQVSCGGATSERVVALTGPYLKLLPVGPTEIGKRLDSAASAAAADLWRLSKTEQAEAQMASTFVQDGGALGFYACDERVLSRSATTLDFRGATTLGGTYCLQVGAYFTCAEGYVLGRSMFGYMATPGLAAGGSSGRAVEFCTAHCDAAYNPGRSSAAKKNDACTRHCLHQTLMEGLADKQFCDAACSFHSKKDKPACVDDCHAAVCPELVEKIDDGPDGMCAAWCHETDHPSTNKVAYDKCKLGCEQRRASGPADEGGPACAAVCNDYFWSSKKRACWRVCDRHYKLTNASSETPRNAVCVEQCALWRHPAMDSSSAAKNQKCVDSCKKHAEEQPTDDQFCTSACGFFDGDNLRACRSECDASLNLGSSAEGIDAMTEKPDDQLRARAAVVRVVCDAAFEPEDDLKSNHACYSAGMPVAARNYAAWTDESQHYAGQRDFCRALALAIHSSWTTSWATCGKAWEHCEQMLKLKVETDDLTLTRAARTQPAAVCLPACLGAGDPFAGGMKAYGKCVDSCRKAGGFSKCDAWASDKKLLSTCEQAAEWARDEDAVPVTSPLVMREFCDNWFQRNDESKYNSNSDHAKCQQDWADAMVVGTRFCDGMCNKIYWLGGKKTACRNACNSWWEDRRMAISLLQLQGDDEQLQGDGEQAADSALLQERSGAALRASHSVRAQAVLSVAAPVEETQSTLDTTDDGDDDQKKATTDDDDDDASETDGNADKALAEWVKDTCTGMQAAKKDSCTLELYDDYIACRGDLRSLDAAACPTCQPAFAACGPKTSDEYCTAHCEKNAADCDTCKQVAAEFDGSAFCHHLCVKTVKKGFFTRLQRSYDPCSFRACEDDCRTPCLHALGLGPAESQVIWRDEPDSELVELHRYAAMKTVIADELRTDLFAPTCASSPDSDSL